MFPNIELFQEIDVLANREDYDRPTEIFGYRRGVLGYKHTDPLLSEANMFEKSKAGIGNDEIESNYYGSLSDYSLENSALQCYSVSSSSDSLSSANFKFSNLGEEITSLLVRDDIKSQIHSEENLSYCENIFEVSNYGDELTPLLTYGDDSTPLLTSSDSEGGEFSNLDLDTLENITILNSELYVNDSEIDLFNEGREDSTVQVKGSSISVDKHKFPESVADCNNKSFSVSLHKLEGINSQSKGNSISKLLPFKIIVKSFTSQKGSTREMVAPFNANHGSDNKLVEIPKSEQSSQYKMILPSLNDELKKPATFNDNNNCSVTKSVVRSANPVEDKRIPHSNKYRPSNQVKNLPFRSARSKRGPPSSSSSSRVKKLKAYQLGPLSDPQMERCRRNAINAKKNREFKKLRITELEKEIMDERKGNEKLAGEYEMLKREKELLKSQLDKMIGILGDTNKLSTFVRKLEIGVANKSDILNDFIENNLNGTY